MKIKLLLAGALSLNLAYSFACSKITNNFGKLGVFTARTMDVCVDLPYDIAVYPRGMNESGGVQHGKDLRWQSKFGSIMVRNVVGSLTANVDGVNEKGLAVNLLYLGGTEYESRNLTKPGVLTFKWAKYVLDNYSTVAEVVKNLHNYQIVNESVRLGANPIELPLHFSIEDASGDNAVIEFIQGKVIVYHGAKYNIMTNEPAYDQQLVNLAKVQATSNYGLEDLPGGADPKNRFVRAYFYSANLAKNPADSNAAVSNMYSAISGVFVPYSADYQKTCSLTGGSDSSLDVWPTQWTTIVDQNHQILYLIDGKTGNQVGVTLSKFNLQPGQPVRTLNPQALKSDIDVSHKFENNK